MDAKARSIVAIIVCSLSVLAGGCALGNLGQKPVKPAPADPEKTPVLVGSTETAAAPTAAAAKPIDPVEQRVLEYISRIEGAGHPPAATKQKPSPTPEHTAAAHPPLPAENMPDQPGSAPDSTRTATNPITHAADISVSPTQAPDAPLAAGRHPPNEQPLTANQPLTPEPLPQLQTSTATQADDSSVETASNAHNGSAAAPIIAGVKARAAASPAFVSAKTDSGPIMNAPASAAAQTASLKEVLDGWLSDAGQDRPFQQQLDTRLLRLATGDYERAREPLSAVTDDQQSMASRMIEALIAVREGHAGEPAKAAGTALQAVDLLSESLRKNVELEIPTVALCREVRGFGQFEAINPPQFRAGVPNELVTYCEIRNFTSRESNSLFETRFDMRTTILTRTGDTVLELKDNDIIDRCRQKRRDCFIPRLVQLPATLSPGEYVTKITIVDKLGDKVAEGRAVFRLVSGS